MTYVPHWHYQQAITETHVAPEPRKYDREYYDMREMERRHRTIHNTRNGL